MLNRLARSMLIFAWCVSEIPLPICQYAINVSVEDQCLRRGFVAFIDCAAQAKLFRFESAGTFALLTFPFCFNPGGSTGTQEI